MKKPTNVKIIQIVSCYIPDTWGSNSRTRNNEVRINGLGDDGIVYRWSKTVDFGFWWRDK